MLKEIMTSGWKETIEGSLSLRKIYDSHRNMIVLKFLLAHSICGKKYGRINKWP